MDRLESDLFPPNIDPLNRIQVRVNQKAAQVVLCPRSIAISNRCDLECSIGGHESCELCADGLSVPVNLDAPLNGIFATQEVNQSLFIKVNAETRSEISDNTGHESLQLAGPGSRWIPGAVIDRKGRAMLARQRRIYELVLDRLGSQIDKLAVCQIREHIDIAAI